jgi:hypothetical protein
MFNNVPTALNHQILFVRDDQLHKVVVVFDGYLVFFFKIEYSTISEL